MVSFDQAVKEQSRTVLCNILGGPDSVPYVGRSVSSNANSIQKAINGFRRWACNDSDNITESEVSDGASGINQDGGQCPGTRYIGNYTLDLRWSGTCPNTFEFGNSGTETYTGQAGTITELYGPVNVTMEVSPQRGGCDNDFRVDGRIFYRDINGNPQDIGFGPFTTGRTDRTLTSYSLNMDWVPQGGPDDCGSPPPSFETPKYNPTPTTVNITYEDNSQTTINEDIDITVYPPIVIAPVTVVAPITIAGNDFSLVGQLDLTGNFDLKLQPEFSINLGGYTDTIPQLPGTEIPSPTPDRTRVILGAIVTVTSLPQDRSQTQIFQGPNPDIFIPRLGYVSFYVAVEGGTAWTGEIPIKNVRQFVPCPYLGGAVDVRGTAEPGYTIEVKPVFAPTPIPELPG